MNPFTPATLAPLAQQFGTPLWIYDAATITRQIAALQLFDVVRFAQKANSNTHILRLMKHQGAVVDSMSLGEIERALAGGFTPGLHNGHADIVFTADLLDRASLARVVELNIPVNCGSMDMLDQLGAVHTGHPVWLRINPGFGHGHSNKTNTGGEHSKHGIWHGDLVRACEKIKSNGLALQGLHMHIGSGVDYAHLQEVCGAMLKLVEGNRCVYGVVVFAVRLCNAERRGWLAKCCFHSRGVSSCTRAAGCWPTRCRTSTR